MIRITRSTRPIELTESVQKSLTDAFLEDNKKLVWNQPYIRKNLLAMTFDKCCYCEKKVGEGATDMHVDHFKPKSLYPQEVVSWNNLLPACADCNRSKSDHDTVAEPIINPTEEDPRQYFYLKDYRYKAFDTNESSKANMTIGVLDLNDLNKKCAGRFIVVAELLDKLSDICQFAKLYSDELTTDTRKKNKVVRTCRDLLTMCIPSAAYSAFTATAMQNDSDYIELREILRNANQWNTELETLDQESRKCVYRTLPLCSQGNN